MYTNDFSTFALFTAGFAALASAYTPPSSSNPDSTLVVDTPLKGAQYTAGTPFSIEWQTNGLAGDSVSLILLDGCPSNCLPVPGFAPIPGTDTGLLAGTQGSFSFMPPTALGKAGQAYGIQMINNANGHFQWSGSFGIGPNGKAVPSSSSSAVAVSSTPSSSAVVASSTPASSVWASSTAVSSVAPVSTVAPWYPTTAIYPTGASSGFLPSTIGANSSVVAPTLASSGIVGGASSSGYIFPTSPPLSSSGAGQLGMSFGGLVVGLAAAVMAF